MPVNQVKRHGSYAPLSAYYYDDDAVIRAGEKAEVLYCRSLAFSARQLTDGLITEAQVTRIGAGLPGLKSRVTKLLEVGLWERVNDESLFGGESTGYRVRNWLKWNLSAEQIAAKQRADANRKRNGSP